MSAERTENARARFETIVAAPDPSIDLLEAALCIAEAHNRRIDLPACRQKLQWLAEGGRFRLHQCESASGIAGALCRYIFEEQGFRGNQADYYDPRNSFIDRVLERHSGIPITLALLYIHVGRAAGLKIEGVGFPGHFLVTLFRETPVIIDPFGGRILSEESCASMLRRGGYPIHSLELFLRPVTNREILSRMLNNLKMIYMNRGNFAESLSAVEWRLVINPDSPRDVLDRGAVLEELGRPADAIEAYEHFLQLAPDIELRDSVREKIAVLKSRHRSSLH